MSAKRTPRQTSTKAEECAGNRNRQRLPSGFPATGQALRSTFLALLEENPNSEPAILAGQLRIPIETARKWQTEHLFQALTPDALRKNKAEWLHTLRELYNLTLKQHRLRLEDTKLSVRDLNRSLEVLGNEYRLWAGQATQITEVVQHLSDEDLTRELLTAYRELGLSDEVATLTVKAYLRVVTMRIPTSEPDQ